MSPPIVPNKSLYRQLTIALIVLVSIVSVTLSLFNYLYNSRESEAIFAGKVAAYSSSLRDSLELPLWNVDDESVREISAAFANNADIASLTILDEEQRVVFQHAKPNGNQVQQVVSLDHEGKHIGSAEIGLSLHAYEEKNKVMLFNSLITALVLIFTLLAALRWLLARLLQKPINALLGVIDGVAEAKYQPMDIPEMYAEFAPIIDRFKTMTEVVANREFSLRQANADLELEMNERQKAEIERRTSERRLRTFYEFDLVGLTITSPEKGWLSVNEYLCKMLEYSEQELFGMTWAQLTHPDDLAADVEQFNQLLAHKIDGYSLEKRFVSRTGKVIPTQMVVRCVRKENGEVDYVLAMVQDISERKRAEQELLRYKDHLEEEVQQRTTDLVLARDMAETAEDSLRESEVAVRRKLLNLLEPEGDIGALQLSDIIDVPELQSLMDQFYRLTNMGCAIIDMDGKVLVGTGWQDICTQFHRCHPESLKHCIESDTILSQGAEVGTYKIYRCKNNMWDMATPIIVGGKQLGNMFFGQFFFRG